MSDHAESDPPRLNQKRGMGLDAFSIEEDGVHVKMLGPGRGGEHLATFMSIPAKSIRVTAAPAWTKPALLVSLGGWLFGLALFAQIADATNDLWGWAQVGMAGMVVLAVGIVLGYVYVHFNWRPGFLVYAGEGSQLVLREDKPSRDAVSNFVETMQAAKRDHFLGRICKTVEVDPSFNPRLAVHNLCNAGLLTEQQRDELETRIESTLAPQGDFGFAKAG